MEKIYAIFSDDGEFIHYESFHKTKEGAEKARQNWVRPEAMGISEIELEE